MATTTENIGLTLTPGSEWATKKYGTFITEMAGQTGSSNLELIDKAVGEDRAAISALEEAVDAIETNIGEINTAIDGVSPEFIIEQNNRTRLKFWLGTTAEYNALSSHAADVWYIITDDNNQEEIDAAMAQIESLLYAHTSNTGNPHKLTLAQLGVTATAAELNVMDGVTATAAEINKLDGLTATTTELNYVDGATSNIQTQLNGKAASNHTHSDYVSKSNTGVQSIAGGIVVGGTSATSTAKGRIMVTGHTNPLIGLQAVDTSGNQLTPYYLQVSNDVMYLGPTSAKALMFDSNGNTTIPANLAVSGSISEGGTMLASKYAASSHSHNNYAATSHTHSDYAVSGHKHAADDITSGTLSVARGGTGVTSNPSVLTNLESTTAASVFAASPRPGVTGTLPIANGGTGATTPAAAKEALEISAEWLNAAHNHQGQNINPSALELNPGTGATHGGYIDFHYGGDMTTDYTTRLWEPTQRMLTVEGANLHINKSSSPQLKLSDTGTGRVAYYLLSSATNALYLYNQLNEQNRNILRINAETTDLKDAVVLVNEVEDVIETYQVLHTGNKPSGSYMGNGSATARSINTGGIGNFCVVWRDNVVGFLLVGPGGALRCIEDGATTVEVITFADGVLNIESSSSHYNGSGNTYNYQVL